MSLKALNANLHLVCTDGVEIGQPAARPFAPASPPVNQPKDRQSNAGSTRADCHQNLVAIDHAVLALIMAAFVRPNRPSRSWSHDSINIAVIVSCPSQPALQLHHGGASAVTTAVAGLIAVAISVTGVPVIIPVIIIVPVSVWVTITIVVSVWVAVAVISVRISPPPAPVRKAEAADEDDVIIIMIVVMAPIASAPALPAPIAAAPIATAPGAAPPTLATPCAHSTASKRVPATVAAARTSVYCGSHQCHCREAT